MLHSTPPIHNNFLPKRETELSIGTYTNLELLISNLGSHNNQAKGFKLTKQRILKKRCHVQIPNYID